MNPISHLKKNGFIFLVIYSFLFCQIAHSIGMTQLELDENYPQWMKDQINNDLSYITTPFISSLEIDEFFHKNAQNLYLIKFSILENKVYVENYFQNDPGINFRLKPFFEALVELCKISHIPNVVFLISMHDGLGIPPSVPVFVMSKRKNSENLILIPDFDALYGNYQVLKGKDVTKYQIPWSKKHAKLIWRGSTAQRALDDETYLLKRDNLHCFSRFILCQLSAKYPALIDAKFTFLAQTNEPIPYINQFFGNYISFETEFEYKYHILIDGNVCAYSCSGWKFFTNSLIFKPDSKWVQWYYDALIPYHHYMPLKNNLEDLVEKISWAKENDQQAKIYASNAREFAIENLTVKSNFLYLYHLIKEYSQCSYVSN